MIACVGAGAWGRNLVRTFGDLGVLSWVCDLSPAIRADVEAAFPAARTTASFDDVLNDAGVTGFDGADAGPVPTALVAVTVKV